MDNQNEHFNLDDINKNLDNKKIICPICNYESTKNFCIRCGCNLKEYKQEENIIKEKPIVNESTKTNNQYQPLFQSQNNFNYNNQNQYGYYQPYYANVQKKKKIWPIIVIVIVVFIFTFIGSLFTTNLLINKYKNNKIYNFDNNISNKSESFAGGISLKELNQIQIGMSYAHVSKIIGGDGELTDQTTTPQGLIYYIYTWVGENNPKTYVHITFHESKVVDIVNQGVTN